MKFIRELIELFFLPIKDLLQGLYAPITDPVKSGIEKEQPEETKKEKTEQEESEEVEEDFDPYKEEF
jgi:hypothetical protein